ncbi:MAG: hypothetical protein PHU25_15045 [Deltaproteobacteria bacterium]|nr:hypothetical protein [Deltaproteobacteria bacterium]
MSVLRWLLLSLGGACFAAWAALFILKTSFVGLDGRKCYCLFDDAMISMRYAWNLSHGNGLVWNPGERVEGFTNLLMTLVMSLATLCFDKCRAVVAVQILGAALMLVTAVFSVRIGERILAERGVSSPVFYPLLFFAAPLVYYPLCYWTLVGMETGLIAALTGLSLWIALRSSGRPELTPSLPVAVGLLFLVRPDTAIPIALILIHRCSSIALAKGSLRTMGKEAVIALAFAAGVSIFRLVYYDSLLPNTYTLKVSGFPLDLRIHNGMFYLRPFWEMSLPLVVLATAIAAINARRSTSLVLLVVLSMIGCQICVGGDAFGMWRMLAPYVPLLFVLTVSGLACAFARLSAGVDPRLPWSVKAALAVFQRLVVLAVFAWTAVHAERRFADEFFLKTPPSYMREHASYARAGMMLREITTPTASVGVTWAGAIPYFSERRGVDFLGKSDKHIAHLKPKLKARHGRVSTYTPGHMKYALRYSIVKQAPTYVGVAKWGRHDLTRYVNDHYERVVYKREVFYLLKGSPDVLWDKLSRPSREKGRKR